jgi:hypothetical protein
MIDNNFETFVRKLGAEFFDQDIDEPSRMLMHLSGHELAKVRDRLLMQFGIELAAGVFEDSGWNGGALVIRANEDLIHLLQVACFAVRLELQRRAQKAQS